MSKIASFLEESIAAFGQSCSRVLCGAAPPLPLSLLVRYALALCVRRRARRIVETSRATCASMTYVEGGRGRWLLAAPSARRDDGGVSRRLCRIGFRCLQDRKVSVRVVSFDSAASCLRIFRGRSRAGGNRKLKRRVENAPQRHCPSLFWELDRDDRSNSLPLLFHITGENKKAGVR